MIDTGFIVVAMLSLTAVMVWAFFKFSPDYADKTSIRVFNYAMLGVIAILCAAFSFKAYVFIAESRYEEFLPILMFLMNMMIIAVGLLFGFLVRNFFIFRSGRLF